MKIKITADSGVDYKRLKKLEDNGFIIIEKVYLENKNNRIRTSLATLFVVGRARISARVGPSEVYDRLLEIMGKNKVQDVMILETHVNSGNDYFITNNPRDFIYNGIREALEGEVDGLKILTIDELEDIFYE